ncbi:MAG: hypothetical protein NUW01_13350, partial [Gemmatimonadaceae bacterium]|nr:hypothetical protein [Gemmatimonadaceae bacterium]
MTWTAAGGRPISFEFSSARGADAPAFGWLGRTAKRDYVAFSYLSRLALAEHTGECDGWFDNAPAALAILPGWEGLADGTRRNKAAAFGTSEFVEFSKGRSGRGAVPSRSRLKNVELEGFDAAAARSWLGIRDLHGMRDMNHGLPWDEMARLALVSSDVQLPYCDAAVVLCPCPGYRGWSSAQVRFRIEDGEHQVASRLLAASTIFPEAGHGGSRKRYSLVKLPARPLLDDASVQEITAVRSEHVVFAQLGLMLTHA